MFILILLLGIAVFYLIVKLLRQRREMDGDKIALAAILSSIIDGLIVIDSKRNIRLMNPQAERSLRAKTEMVFGKPLEAVWPLREVNALVSEGLEQSTIVSREIALPYNVLKLYVVPIPRVIWASAILIFRDVTELRRLEQLRNQFLSQVSHELRTPLTIVKGYLVTLLDDPRLADAPDDIKKILFRTEEETDRLTKLVEEMLELSRLKSGRSALNFAPVALKDLVFETVETLKPHAERYEIELVTKESGTIPPILGDARGLRRVFVNLIDNAVKYSKKGGKVVVSVSGNEKASSVQIHDEGTGIPKEDLPHVFERFFQGRRTAERKGWGLGLPIVKEIVEGHDGKIRIESIEEKGTTVTVTLPAEGLRVEERKI